MAANTPSDPLPPDRPARDPHDTDPDRPQDMAADALGDGPLTEPLTPTGGPRSGFFDPPPAAPADGASRSSADIDLPPPGAVLDEPSDIFSTHRGGRPVPAEYLTPPPAAEAGQVSYELPARSAESTSHSSDLFSHIRGAADTNSSGPLEPNFDPLPGLPGADSEGDSSGHALRLDAADPSGPGSNLLGGDDATLEDLNLAAADEASGVNLLDPDRPGHPDGAGPQSSIFGRPHGDGNEGDGIDLDEIPIMASTDDPTEDMRFSLDPTADDEDDGVGIHAPPPSRATPTGRASTARVGSALPHADDEDEDDLTADIDITNPEHSGGHAPPTEEVLFDEDDEPAAPPSRKSSRQSIPAARAYTPADEPDDGGASVFDAPGDADEPAGRSLTATLAAAPDRRRADDEDHEEGAVPRSRGWVGGGVIGLLLGAGGMAAAYFGGLLPSTAPASTSPAATAPTGGVAAVAPAAAGGLAEAQALLKTDPARAVAAFEALGDAPEAKAGQGQARWLAQVRAAAEAGRAVNAGDPEVAKAADELQAAYTAAEQNSPAGVRAALHLGLIKEAAGNPAEAIRIYNAAAGKHPAFGKVFATAKNRVTNFAKLKQFVPVRGSTLAPAAVRDLAHANVLLLAFDPVQELENEPGYLFWDAITDSVAWKYPSAKQKIEQAYLENEKRRRLKAGAGENPLSDPMDEAFSAACLELSTLYQFKARLYEDKDMLAVLRAKGTNGTLQQLIDTHKGAGSAATGELAAARTQLAAARAEAKAAKDAADKAKADLSGTEQARADLAARVAGLQGAADKLADAEKKVAAAEGDLDKVLGQLKAAKLIDADADRPAAVAALPDAVKKLAAGTGNLPADAAAKVAAAEAEARKAKEEADKRVAAVEERTKGLDAKLAEAARQTAAAEAKGRETAAQLEARAKQLEQTLAAERDQFQRQVAAARAAGGSGVVPVTDTGRAAGERAEASYNAGLDRYFAGRIAEAEARFADAVKADEKDARYWYFLGLTKWLQGKAAEAEADFKTGATWEANLKPGHRAINAALERVQGQARRVLDSHRP